MNSAKVQFCKRHWPWFIVALLAISAWLQNPGNPAPLYGLPVVALVLWGAYRLLRAIGIGTILAFCLGWLIGDAFFGNDQEQE